MICHAESTELTSTSIPAKLKKKIDLLFRIGERFKALYSVVLLDVTWMLVHNTHCRLHVLSHWFSSVKHLISTISNSVFRITHNFTLVNAGESVRVLRLALRIV